LGQVRRGGGERPAGAGQGQELFGVGADEAVDAQAVVQGVAAGTAGRADAVQPLQAAVPRRGQDVAPGGAFVAEAAATGAGAAGHPFFSAAWAWACRVACTAWRASSRAAGTARASTRASTWPSGAASAVAWSC